MLPPLPSYSLYTCLQVPHLQNLCRWKTQHSQLTAAIRVCLHLCISSGITTPFVPDVFLKIDLFLNAAFEWKSSGGGREGSGRPALRGNE